MNQDNVIILGAGLAGLLAACRFKSGAILEAGPQRQEHQALLRFRDESVSTLTGIPFKRVTVHKGVWDTMNERLITGECPLDVANQYSLKVTGGLTGRSVSNLKSETRYIAPDDFQLQLQERFKDRILYESPAGKQLLRMAKDKGQSIVSTIPLPAMIDLIGLDVPKETLSQTRGAPIIVTRIKLAVPSDIYQTVYFPQRSLQVYRASITGDTLIIEGIAESATSEYASGELRTILRAFGLSLDCLDMSTSATTQQRFGKIVDLPKDTRAALLYELTANHGVFSVGRFACWRNILLDHVAGDIEKVAQLIDASDYTRRLKLFSK